MRSRSMRRNAWMLLLLPLFLKASPVISTERDLVLNESQKFALASTPYGVYYQDVLEHPAVLEDTPTFRDEELTQVGGKLTPNQSFTIKEFYVNSLGTPIFKLDNHQFISAQSQIVFEDQVLARYQTDQTMWAGPQVLTYEAPYRAGMQAKPSSIKPYSPVVLEEIAETTRGSYAKIKGDGWIKMDDLSEEDRRIELVQARLNERFNRENVSIYVKQLDTGQTAGINPDKEMYAASVLKTAFLYEAEDRLRSGSMKADQPLKYVAEVNDAYGAYDAAGSGSLPKEADQKDYALREVMDKTAKESDNVGSNLLNYYAANKSDRAFLDKIAKIAGKKWDVEERMASARMAGQVMEAIYQQNGSIIEALSATQFDDQRISKNIPDKVAHKIGDADDYRHDVAIVYAKTPFILSVFTEHASYDDITAIADLVYEVYK